MKEPDQTIKLYNGKITIDFYEGRHTYIVRETGKRPISVTKATGMIDKPALKFWAANMGRDFLLEMLKGKKEINENAIIEASKQHTVFTKKAASIGDVIHDFAENHAKGIKQEMSEDEKTLNGEIAFLKWVEDYKIKFIAAEEVVYSKRFKYVGKFDNIFTMGKDEKHKILHLGDYKTGSYKKITDRKGNVLIKTAYDEHRYQTAGYQNAKIEESGKEFGDRCIVYFGKDDGEFNAFMFGEYEKDRKTFLGALEIAKREREIKEEEKEKLKELK